MKNKKRIIIFLGIIIVGLVAILVLGNLTPTGKSINSQQIETVPLSAEEQQKVFQTLSSSDFFQDIPKKNPIALTFFSFGENGQRIWRDGFLMAGGQFLTQGEPTIYLMLHAKYISEFNGNNLCEMIQRASKNGDLALDSEYGKASLLIKYAGMLKYRDCFGF